MQKNLKNMEDARISKTEIRSSNISGQGTFAKKKISAGEYITTLTGIVMTTVEAKKICLAKGISDDDPLQIGDNLYLILDHSSKVINHSCNPNASLRNISDLYALRDINTGEEITYDYSTSVGINDQIINNHTHGTHAWSMECHCGSDNCRKNIGDISTLPPDTLKKYLTLNAFQDFIKRQILKMNVLI